MKYYRCWKGEPQELKEQEDEVGWFEVTKETCHKVLNWYVKSAVCIDTELKNGNILQNDFAYYIAIKENQDGK